MTPTQTYGETTVKLVDSNLKSYFSTVLHWVCVCVCPTYKSSSPGLLHHFPILFQSQVSSFLRLTALHVSIFSSHIPSPLPLSLLQPHLFLSPHSVLSLTIHFQSLLSLLFDTPHYHVLTGLILNVLSTVVHYQRHDIAFRCSLVHPYASPCVIPTNLEARSSLKIAVGKQIRKLALIIAS